MEQGTLEINSKLERILENVVNFDEDRINSNRIRQITKIIARKYKDDAKGLIDYFTCENDAVKGVATSAYAMITGDLNPITECHTGGLGVILNSGGKGMEFRYKQLWGAKLSGNALQESKNSDCALYKSENSCNALWGSKNTDHVLKHSKNSEDALIRSNNSGNALWGSKNSGYALIHSKNSGWTLYKSKNSGNALHKSKNSGYALWKYIIAKIIRSF